MPPEFVEVNDHAARFVTEGQAPDEHAGPLWVPGAVEVEFREDFPSHFLALLASSDNEIPLGAASDTATLDDLLQKHRLDRFEPTLFGAPIDSILLAEADLTASEWSNFSRHITYHFPSDSDVLAIADELRNLPNIIRAVPVPRLAPPSTPSNEPYYQEQWYIPRCGIDRAWEKATGNGVVVADIDWGFVDHEDLQDRVKLRFNSITESSDVTHSDNIALLAHGTAVLGLIGAADNDLGMTGIAFNAELWAIQAGDDQSTSDPEYWAKAIKFVCDQPTNGQRKVIALEAQTQSRRNVEMNAKISEAIKHAIAAKVVVCVAAGNRGGDAGLDDLHQAIPDTGSILVGATDFHLTENRRSRDSNRGARITVFAPGDKLRDLTCSVVPQGYRTNFGGTSGATAKVAAAVALMLEVNSNLDHENIRTILRKTGTPMEDADVEPGNTFLNVRKAVLEAERLNPG